MMRCRQVVEGATDYTEGAGGPLFRRRVDRHLRGCADCRTYLAQLRATRQLLPGLAGQQGLAVEQQQWALDAYRKAREQWAASSSPGQARSMGASPVAEPMFATLLASGLALLVAQRLAVPGPAWIEAAVFALVGAGLAGLASRRAGLALTLSALGALALLVLTPRGALAPEVGLRCALHACVSAAFPVAAWLHARGATGGTRVQLIALSASGALASDAALHVTCPAGGSQLHALVFHLGGMLVAAALTGVLGAKLLAVGQRAS